MLLNRLLGDVKAQHLRDTGAKETRAMNEGSEVALSNCLLTCIILLLVLVASQLSVYYGKDNPRVSPRAPGPLFYTTPIVGRVCLQ